jgi:hypothetical protein
MTYLTLDIAFTLIVYVMRCSLFSGEKILESIGLEGVCMIYLRTH